ncbi:MAG TPA: NlpC/P60 family protein, partial [Candidatus Norongarragalinales archaeon]|nr:NlpC/P60 family protein [Candidatus Norongarragalinales archaeon]
QGLPFQLDTSVTKLPSHFGTQGYSSLLLGIDDSTASLYVLSQNTPPELVKKIAGFFFDESASADLPPQSCQVLLNSDLKYLLMTCELQKVVPAPASPLSAPLPLAKDDPESTIVAQPGPLAWEDPLKGTVATEAVQTLSFASKNPFGESLFYVLPFAPGENFEGASIKEMCQKDLVNAERYDFAPHRRFMKWLDKTVRDSKDAVSKIGGKSVFFGKTQLCVVYSNGNQYEDLVFQLARVDPDGSEAIIRQKKCTYSTDRTPGRKNPCATQNDPTPGFHSVIWDTTQPVYNPLKTSEYLDAGKTYRLRMIGSVLHEGKKTITHFENYAYIQSEQGMYRERVVFGNLVIKTTNLALPVRLTWDGAFVGILQPGQTQAEFILPVGKHRLKICDTDRDIVLLPVIPFIENVDCKGASFASEETFSKAVDRFITEAKKFIGQAYVWGGTSITGYSGVDCSGLIVSAYQKTMATGFKHKDLKGSFCTSGKLARTADEQFTCLYQNAQSLSSPSDLLPGDLIFEEVSSQCFQLSPKKEVGQRLGECYVGKGGLGIGHVLIYLGNKKLDPQGKLISADTLEASGDNVHSGKDRGFEKILDFARIPWSSTESPDQKETLEKDGKSGEGGGGDGKTVWIS